MASAESGSQLKLGPPHSTESGATNRNKGQLPTDTYLDSSDAGAQRKAHLANKPLLIFIASFFSTRIHSYHTNWSRKFHSYRVAFIKNDNLQYENKALIAILSPTESLICYQFEFCAALFCF